MCERENIQIDMQAGGRKIAVNTYLPLCLTLSDSCCLQRNLAFYYIYFFFCFQYHNIVEDADSINSEVVQKFL